MKLGDKKVLICDCEGTMPLDDKALAKAAEGGKVTLNNHLCRAQLANFEAAVSGSDEVLVACTQEAPLFAEVAQEKAPDTAVSYVNIRERAGWSEQAERATPKIAALLAEAALDPPTTPTVTMISQGRVLAYGTDQTAVDAARQLSGRMDVHCLLTSPEDVLPPGVTDVPLFRGTVKAAHGHLGAFEVTVDEYAPIRPSSRAAAVFEDGRRDATLQYDIVLDLTRSQPLFTGGERRDGYFAPDPRNPAQVQKALFDITNLVGEFEKPRYVRYDEGLCVHGRSGQTGCTRCLDVCPAGAITSAGDLVAIDPHVCAGCGACASVCPTGAASYDLPSGTFLFERLRTLLGAYRKAKGRDPVLLVHDVRHGTPLIEVTARAGRGLPAKVLPFAVNEVTQVGFDFLAVALAYGVSRVLILTGPANAGDLDGLTGQVELADTAMAGLGYGAGRVAIMDQSDPSALEAALYDLAAVPALACGNFLVMGGKRSTISLALTHLHDNAPDPVDMVPLQTGAPFGAVEVDTAGCTLCLSCVSACPTGALQDDPDAPKFSFVETACVQCGLCRTTCPESVITLTPRFNFTEDARRPRVKNEEEPFHCVRCGQPFGVKSSVERMIEKLSGHSMFAEEGALDRIRMCQDCRVIDQFERRDQPLAAGPRPKPRTTDDYLREREEAEANAKKKRG